MGAFVHLRLLRQSLDQIDVVNQLPIFVMDMEGEDIFDSGTQLSEGIYVFGNEGNGVDFGELTPYSYTRISIPKVADNHIDSLNVSMAVAITLSQYYQKNLN